MPSCALSMSPVSSCGMSFSACSRTPRIRSSVLSDVSHSTPSAVLIAPASPRSLTPSTTPFRFAGSASSSSAARSSCRTPSLQSLMFSNAFDASANGLKLSSLTMLPNF